MARLFFDYRRLRGASTNSATAERNASMLLSRLTLQDSLPLYSRRPSAPALAMICSRHVSFIEDYLHQLISAGHTPRSLGRARHSRSRVERRDKQPPGTSAGTNSMSQYQPNAAPSRSFMAKVNSKFSGLSVSALKLMEKDGSSEDETLVHKALVDFYESRNAQFPEWLGVKEHSRKNRGRHLGLEPASHTQALAAQNSRFQPVRASYNSMDPIQKDTSAGFLPQHAGDHSAPGPDGEERPYARRTNSRLQQMYNKTRQHSLPGSGYTSQSQLSLPLQAPVAGRANALSQRLRDRVMNGGSYSEESSTRPTWGN